MIVYILKDPLDNLIKYVGISNNTAWHRFKTHRKDAKTRKRKGEYLSRKDKWILKLDDLGLVPIIETVFEGNEEDAVLKEVELIRLYKRSYEGGSLLNVQEGGYYVSDMTIPWNKGVKNCYDEDLLKNNREKQPNRKTVYRFDKDGKLLDEWLSLRFMCDSLNLDRRAVMRCLNKSQNFISHKGFMFSHCEEPPVYLNKSSLNTGPRHHRRKVVGQKDGKIYQFESIKIAAASLGVNPTSISSVLSGRYRTAGGYTWKYL
ncbi:hypothetical protein [Bacteroides sp. 224]|uniref:hypothetical protein n=1 Tax=Bacteroides sp. 224 TaxID=2302936 RepID=UPI0013D264BE|nr:hypothetical protein [Bacteroides sp. 224]NDV63905.1 hypothetical protein [Bacteroides sp. 224]